LRERAARREAARRVRAFDPPGFPGPHLIALRAIYPLPQGARESDRVLAMQPHPSFGNERHEVFASNK